jgi:hypothetical protein
VLVVSADGAHTPTRPETGTRKGTRGRGTWQEVKGFRFYLVGQERIEQILSWQKIGTEAEFGEALRFAAKLIPAEKVRIGLVADGAQWIWSHSNDVFPEGREILDSYHCSERIYKIAEILFPDDQEARFQWVEATMGRLHFGDVDLVIFNLKRLASEADADGREEIRLLIGYLENNAHRIDYAFNRRGQYAIGSGGIESANKFIAHKRLKVSGAWWYKINGNRMLKLRCAVYNGTFDEVFREYMKKQVRGAVRAPKVSPKTTG